jgi:hypothetical protein
MNPLTGAMCSAKYIRNYAFSQLLGSRLNRSKVKTLGQVISTWQYERRAFHRQTWRAEPTVATGTSGGLVKVHHHNAPEEARQLYAASNGMPHLYVQPPAEAESLLKVSLQTEHGHISLGNAFSL